jgi:hypothetical protein
LRGAFGSPPPDVREPVPVLVFSGVARAEAVHQQTRVRYCRILEVPVGMLSLENPRPIRSASLYRAVPGHLAEHAPTPPVHVECASVHAPKPPRNDSIQELGSYLGRCQCHVSSSDSAPLSVANWRSHVGRLEPSRYPSAPDRGRCAPRGRAYVRLLRRGGCSSAPWARWLCGVLRTGGWGFIPDGSL